MRLKRRVVVLPKSKTNARSLDFASFRFAKRCFARDDSARDFDGSGAAVCRVNFMVKLLRAHGGCLGRSRR